MGGFGSTVLVRLREGLGLLNLCSVSLKSLIVFEIKGESPFVAQPMQSAIPSLSRTLRSFTGPPLICHGGQVAIPTLPPVTPPDSSPVKFRRSLG